MSEKIIKLLLLFLQELKTKMTAAQQEASEAQKLIDQLSKEKKSLQGDSEKTCDHLDKTLVYSRRS